MITFRGVSFRYRARQPVLAAVDLDIPAGLTLLLGRNGCGKSTLLRLAAGIEPPDAGSIAVDGHDLWQDEVAARMSLAFVPEQPDLTPYATLGEILHLVCSLRHEGPARAGEALAAVGLEGLGGRSVRELSMGQRRRAALAAARIGTPGHLLLDEPLDAMDAGSRGDLLAWIEGRRAAGAVVVIASHELAPFAAAAARAITVCEGRTMIVDPLPPDPVERGATLAALARG